MKEFLEYFIIILFILLCFCAVIVAIPVIIFFGIISLIGILIEIIINYIKKLS